MNQSRLKLFFVLLFAFASSGLAQTIEPAWGTQSAVTYTVSAYELLPYDSSQSLLTTNGNGANRKAMVANTAYEAALHLPSGAFVNGIRIMACIGASAFGLNANVYECDELNCGIKGYVNAYTQGCATTTGNVFSPFTVDNNTKSYIVDVNFYDTVSSATAIKIDYQLQVSPPPATATFTDVPTTHLFYQYVEALAAAGITSGCGGGNYCPDAAVTRGQMAVFLARALGLHWPN